MANSIGENIRKRRMELNYSQKHVADYLGISQQAYSKYENNLNSFNFETALKLGEILETSLDDLGLDYRTDESSSNILLSEHETKLILSYRNQSEAVQAMIDKMLDIVPISFNVQTARAAACGGGTFDVPATNVSKEELDRMVEESEIENELAKIKKNQKGRG